MYGPGRTQDSEPIPRPKAGSHQCRHVERAGDFPFAGAAVHVKRLSGDPTGEDGYKGGGIDPVRDDAFISCRSQIILGRDGNASQILFRSYIHGNDLRGSEHGSVIGDMLARVPNHLSKLLLYQGFQLVTREPALLGYPS